MLIGALLLSGCERTESRASLPPSFPDRTVADVHADSLIARALRDDATLRNAEVVAVGYFEQLRLGLGSPFRLVERAMADDRLPQVDRAVVAQALLGRIARGESYRAATAVGDAIGAAGGSWLRTTRGLDERLIGQVMAAAPDPWTGELAVRVGYTLAAAAGAAGDSALAHAAEVAALWRDRALASMDVQRLRDAANASRVAPAALLSRWRAARLFAVEAPPLERDSHGFDDAAIALARVLADSAIARSTADTALRWELTDAAMPLVGPAVAARWAALARARGTPPRAAVVVDLRTARLLVVRGDTRSVRAAFLRHATNEETLAAEHAVAWWSAGAHPGMARAVRRVAVSLRAYAQEPVLPASLAIDVVRQVRRRYGLAALTFDAEIPVSWRPQYAVHLDDALTDLRRVVPAIDVRGLRVHFGRSPRGSDVLAIHEPRGRRLFLPPGTSSGTLAHELGHDLDWIAVQRGDYATDQAIRRGGRRLSEALARLSSDSLIVPASANDAGRPNRPTEVFARSFDWFVTSVLASWGRSNGHLSGAQDAIFVGHARAARPGWRGTTATALIELLSDMTTIPEPTVETFLALYGPVRVPSIWDAVLGVLDVTEPSLDQVMQDLDSARRLSDARLDLFAESYVRLFAGQSCGSAITADTSVIGLAWSAAEAVASARSQGIVQRWASRPIPPAASALRPALADGPWDPTLRDELEQFVCGWLLARWYDDASLLLAMSESPFALSSVSLAWMSALWGPASTRWREPRTGVG
jgi:hypothetical protein